MLPCITKRLPYPVLMLTVALALQLQPGGALPAGRRVRTPEVHLLPRCRTLLSLDREAVANRIRTDAFYITSFTKDLVDGMDQTIKISELEGWSDCSTVAVTPGTNKTELPTELMQISNHFWSMQHLSYMYRLLVAVVKGNTTAANGAKLDMLNMFVVSLQYQIEMYLHSEQCTHQVADSVSSLHLNTTNLFDSLGQGECNTWSLLGRVIYDINIAANATEKIFRSKGVISESVLTCSNAFSALNSLPSGMRMQCN